MSTPISFRKLPIREDGEFAQLPLYVRGLAAMILKFSDKEGRFALGAQSPAEAVARRCGAERGERRRLAQDLQMLVDVDYLRLVNGALIIVGHETRGKKTKGAT